MYAVSIPKLQISQTSTVQEKLATMKLYQLALITPFIMLSVVTELQISNSINNFTDMTLNFGVQVLQLVVRLFFKIWN